MNLHLRFDSITGIPCKERNIVSEKVSILFNAAALCSQAAIQQSRSSLIGLETSSEYFQKSAGILNYILDHFREYCSKEYYGKDISDKTLKLLINLMIIQAREASFLMQELCNDSRESCDVAKESARLSLEYESLVLHLVNNKCVIPYTWNTLFMVKQSYYAALADYSVAVEMLANDGNILKDIKEHSNLGDMKDQPAEL